MKTRFLAVEATFTQYHINITTTIARASSVMLRIEHMCNLLEYV